MGPTIFLRSVGDWEVWGQTNMPRSAGNIPQAPLIEVGDLIMVYAWCAGCVSNNWSPTSNPDGGWSRVNTGGGFPREFWTRIATGDSNDNFAGPALTSAGGQARGGVQMAVIAGLQWTKPAYQDTATVYDNRLNGWFTAGWSVISAADQLTIIVNAATKNWDKNRFPGPISTPYYGTLGSEALETIGEKENRTEDSHYDHYIWGWKYEASGDDTSSGTITLNQNPLDVITPYGYMYTKTTRCIEDPT